MKENKKPGNAVLNKADGSTSVVEIKDKKNLKRKKGGSINLDHFVICLKLSYFKLIREYIGIHGPILNRANKIGAPKEVSSLCLALEISSVEFDSTILEQLFSIHSKSLIPKKVFIPVSISFCY